MTLCVRVCIVCAKWTENIVNSEKKLMIVFDTRNEVEKYGVEKMTGAHTFKFYKKFSKIIIIGKAAALFFTIIQEKKIVSWKVIVILSFMNL